MNLRSLFARRSKALEDFADAMRGELGEMRVPASDEHLLERIRASRAAGARVILPMDDPRASRRPMIVLSAVAAAAIAVAVLGRALSDRGLAPVPASESWFVSDLAYASAAQSPRLEAARVTRGARLRPMSLDYSLSARDSNGTTRTVESALVLSRDTVDGNRAWRLVATRRRSDGRSEVDSVWVAEGGLAPLRQAIASSPYRSYERLEVRQRFHDGRVSGDMNAFRAGALSAHRTFDRALPEDAAPYVPDAFAPIYLIGVELSREWTGRVSLLGWAVRDDNVSALVNMRVAGEDTVRVPAGEFACWRLAVEYGGRTQLHWVRKSDGLGIRMLDSTNAGTTAGVREIVLGSEVVRP